MSAFGGLPVAQWPEADWIAWQKARTSRARLFGVQGTAAKLSPYTVRLYEGRYGIWLRFLQDISEQHPEETPDQRVKPERLDLLVAAMELAGRKPGTIKVAIAAVHAILTHMVPEADFDFMLRPGGTTLGRVFASAPKPFPLIDTEEVMARAQALRAAAREYPAPIKAALMLRDAAMMAVFARRAPRVGTMASLRLGAHVQGRAGGGFHVRMAGEIMKFGRQVGWDLDADVAAIFWDYLDRARPVLLRRERGYEAGDAVWLGMDGRPLDRIGVAGIFLRRTGDWFDEASGPHTARKWLKDSAGRRSPQLAMDAAEVMGHAPGTSLRHYTSARERAATGRFVTSLKAERRECEALAHRFYAQRGLIRR
jgi:hypothetical protein